MVVFRNYPIRKLLVNEKDLWSELFLANREPLLHQIRAFEAELATLRQTIETQDRAALQEKMRTSTKRRKEFDTQS